MSNYISNLFDLQGRVVAITGAGGHLCSEMARGFANAGCSVILLDLRLHKILAIQEELSSEGFSSVLSLPLNVSSRNEFQSVLSSCISTFGSVDVLINGAGINSATPFLDISLEDWNSVISSQLTSTFLGCQILENIFV